VLLGVTIDFAVQVYFCAARGREQKAGGFGEVTVPIVLETDHLACFVVLLFSPLPGLRQVSSFLDRWDMRRRFLISLITFSALIGVFVQKGDFPKTGVDNSASADPERLSSFLGMSLLLCI